MVPIARLFTGSVSFEVTVDFLLGKQNYTTKLPSHQLLGVDLHQAIVGHVLGRSAGQNSHIRRPWNAGREDPHGRNCWEWKFIS